LHHPHALGSTGKSEIGASSVPSHHGHRRIRWLGELVGALQDWHGRAPSSPSSPNPGLVHLGHSVPSRRARSTPAAAMASWRAGQRCARKSVCTTTSWSGPA